MPTVPDTDLLVEPTISAVNANMEQIYLIFPLFGLDSSVKGPSVQPAGAPTE